MPVKRRRDPPDLGLIVGVDRNDTGNAWTAFADRASLIDSERLELPIVSRNALHLMCTPRRAIAVRPETTLLFSTGIDSPVRDGVPLTTAPSKGTPGNVLWTCEVGGLFAL